MHLIVTAMKIQRQTIGIIVKLFMVLLALTLVSCEQRTTDSMADDDYRSGKEGIEINFALNSPPSKVYEGSPLSITAEVRNKGAFDNDPTPLGTITLHGFDASAMPFDGATGNYVQKELPLVRAKNPYLKEGGYDFVRFEIKDKSLLCQNHAV